MVTVKRIGGGVFSNWVGDHLKAGDAIDVMPPHGSFTTNFDPGTGGIMSPSPAARGSRR